MTALENRPNHDQLKSALTPLQFKVTQEKFTEKPKTGRFDCFQESGVYGCVVCREDLFTSNFKYDSGCGWPAFFDSLESKVAIERDYQLIGDDVELLQTKPHLVRNEIVCAKCRSHLGHIFEDGPLPTRKRFCVNSASLIFKPNCSERGELSDEGTGEPDRDIDVCCRD